MDTIISIRKDGKRDTLYRGICGQCGAKRGYIKKASINNLCKQCVAVRISLSKKGKPGPNLRKKFSEETRKKMSLAKIGKVTWNKGLKEERYEVRLKMSLAKLGVVPWNKGTGSAAATISVKCLIRHRTRKFIKGAPKHQDFAALAGCSREELIKHIESQFTIGMTWKNWTTTGWHIDHKRPLASFDLLDAKQLKDACHYTNLQPLWAKDNLRKGSRQPFSKKTI